MIKINGILSPLKIGVAAYLSTPTDTTITEGGVYQYIAGAFTNIFTEYFTLVGTPGIRYDYSLTQYFEIDWHVTLSCNHAGCTVSLGVAKNTALITGSNMSVYCKTAGELYCASGTIAVSLAKNDEIQLIITSDATSDVITVQNFTTTINKFFNF